MARVIMRIDDRDVRRAQRRLLRVPDQIRDACKTAVRESSEAIRAQVRRTVGVFRGRLRERIRARRVGDLTSDVGWFDRDTYYAKFVEFGTSKIRANPVLTRAGLEEEARFPRRVRDHIRRAIE